MSGDITVEVGTTPAVSVVITPTGARGPKGDTGDVTPELLAARDTAEAAAINAATSETNAASSATAAATSDSDAATSASQAASSAGIASTGAAAASGSATAAATSATSASTSATSASGSATTATGAATNAATSETNAATSATSASGSASTASTAATAAAGSATGAATSATAAGTSASDAAGSASTATTQASAAAGSAGAAATSATNSHTSEVNAGTSSSAAGTSATNAAASATGAAGSATSAAGSASGAATSATGAATSATTASSAAGNAATSATAAAGSASSAASSAAAAAGASDSGIAALVTNSASVTSAALVAAYAPSSWLRGFDNPGNFLHWRKALTRVRAGTSDARVLVVGDSTSAGIGSSTAGTVPQWNSWPQKLAGILNSSLVPCAPGLAVPKSSSSAQPADTRWTPGTGWTLNGYTPSGGNFIGFGGKGMYWYSTTASTPLVFADSTILTNTFDVFYLNLAGSSSIGSFTVQATGGSSLLVNASAGPTSAIMKATVTAATASTSNTVTITHDATNKTAFIVSVEGYLSTATKVRIGNASATGSQSSDWVSPPLNNAANHWGALDSIKTYAPDLTIIDLGINDAGNGVSTSTYLANMSLVIAAAQASGDVIIKTMLPGNPATTPNRIPGESDFVTNLLTLGLPVIDMFGRIMSIGGYATYQAQGFMSSDGIHGTDYGYGDEAELVARALRTIS